MAPADTGPWRDITVPPEAEGRRVDAWLAERYGNWSRTEVARLLARGEIVAEGRRLKPSSLLRAGERLRVRLLDPAGPPPPLPPVLHEDDVLLVLDKPAGLLCHPTGRRFVHGIIGLARAARPEAPRLDLVHRLDRETSGVLVLTKTARANAFLKQRFMRGEEVAKEYLAIVRGVVPWDRRVVDAPIGPATDSEIRIRRTVRPDGRPARTEVEVVRRMAAHTLVRCRLRTGRTHQIRVHLEHVGFPVLGDKMYGQPDRTFLHWLEHGEDEAIRRAVGFPRHALHAWRVDLPHPEDGRTVRVESPLPPDLRAIVEGAEPSWPAPAPPRPDGEGG